MKLTFLTLFFVFTSVNLTLFTKPSCSVAIAGGVTGIPYGTTGTPCRTLATSHGVVLSQFKDVLHASEHYQADFPFAFK